MMRLSSPMRPSPALPTHASRRKGYPMRLLSLCAGYRLGSQYVMLGIETVMALTLCALLARAVILL
jgi:hypothetical protein